MNYLPDGVERLDKMHWIFEPAQAPSLEVSANKAPDTSAMNRVMTFEHLNMTSIDRRKKTDDYNAKYAIWAKERKVHPLPKMDLPVKFPPKCFSSYEELNRWKKELIVEVAKLGGCKWSK